MTVRTVIANAEVDGRCLAVVIEDGRIVELAEHVDVSGAEVIDALGGALLPGLHDHHVHLLGMAARREGVNLDELADELAVNDALRSAAESVGDGWVRASGYDEHRHGALDRARLDSLVGGTKVRVQHRSGLAWVLSSAGLDEVCRGDVPEGVERDERGQPTGRLLRLDRWLAERVGTSAPSVDAVGIELASFGITGVTDATPNLGGGRLELLRHATTSGALPQRLTVLGVADDDRAALKGWATMGPAKLLIDEVIALDPEAVAHEIAAHHRSGRAVAIHAVSRVETVTAVTALSLAGMIPGDRIEHGSVLPSDLDAALAAGGVTVIVQPGLVYERGDHYLDAVDAEDFACLHRAASLLNAGVRVAAGSDAPVTSVDPWRAIAAASNRLTRNGARLGTEELVPASTALGWYLTDPLDPGGPIRRLRVGAPADLCLLDAPLQSVLEEPDASHVQMTWVGGRLVHS